jgi:hypothetical protein
VFGAPSTSISRTPGVRLSNAADPGRCSISGGLASRSMEWTGHTRAGPGPARSAREDAPQDGTAGAERGPECSRIAGYPARTWALRMAPSTASGRDPAGILTRHAPAAHPLGPRAVVRLSPQGDRGRALCRPSPPATTCPMPAPGRPTTRSAASDPRHQRGRVVVSRKVSPRGFSKGFPHP